MLVNNIGACAERTEQKNTMLKQSSAKEFNGNNLCLKINTFLDESFVLDRGLLLFIVFDFTGLLSVFV